MKSSAGYLAPGGYNKGQLLYLKKEEREREN